VVPNPAWPAAQVELGSAWTLILFTDGIIEARSQSGELLDTAGLVDVAAESLARSPDLDGFADDLIAGAETASAGPIRDDVALFVLATEARWRD
jgi:serine phosphatase RsbU (regulator of sigma subunit)